ncbi:MAG: precorrin-6A synthase (deacetylating) [Pseudomonadota bacterium]
MHELALVGVGSAHPDHVTPAARRTLMEADLILLPHKGAEKADLADLRQALLAGLGAQATIVEFEMPARDRDGPDYLAGVEDWHDRVAGAWAGCLRSGLPHGGRAALMIWGDPSLYDSSLRIANRLPALGLPIVLRVIPGLTSMQLLTAAHTIPLNALGAPVIVTTGRRLREEGWPEGVERAVVMLDGSCSFRHLPYPDRFQIWWGAYLGMAEEMLESGRLDIAGPKIVAARAAARERHGWIMDIYLLERLLR